MALKWWPDDPIGSMYLRLFRVAGENFRIMCQDMREFSAYAVIEFQLFWAQSE